MQASKHALCQLMLDLYLYFLSALAAAPVHPALLMWACTIAYAMAPSQVQTTLHHATHG